jgi:hypothetical protein
MQMNGSISCKAQLSAILITADGNRHDVGVLAKDDLSKQANLLNRLRHCLASFIGPSAAVLLLVGMAKTGKISPMALSMLGIVTTAGVNYMASDFASGGVTPTISGFKFHDSGVGTTAAAVGDTTIQTAATPAPARVSGTPSNPSANQYRSVATVAYTGTNAITEWGLFSASSAGSLWDRRVFSAINVVNGDSIQFTYTLTVNNGGT